MAKIGLNLYIDVSGTPYTLTIPALVSIQTHQLSDLEKELKRTFFEGRSFQKGNALSAGKLLSIMRFLDSKGVRMFALGFKQSEWEKYRKLYGQRANFKEKIMAALYLRLLSRTCRPRYRYNANICQETWMKSTIAFSHFKDLSKANKYLIDFSPTLQKYCSLLRLADYVASASRKNTQPDLLALNNFFYVDGKIPSRHLRKLFELR